MTDYHNKTDVEIITSILEEYGFDGAGTAPLVPDTTWFDTKDFTSLFITSSQKRYKAVQTPEGWDVIETTQEEANND